MDAVETHKALVLNRLHGSPGMSQPGVTTRTASNQTTRRHANRFMRPSMFLRTSSATCRSVLPMDSRRHFPARMRGPVALEGRGLFPAVPAPRGLGLPDLALQRRDPG